MAPPLAAGFAAAKLAAIESGNAALRPAVVEVLRRRRASRMDGSEFFVLKCRNEQ
ncbi:MAG: hypothetical protein IH606_23085 [Burkholderiales bacterium]|nr:hypothetical protein [Burkholderiales bacterium]